MLLAELVQVRMSPSHCSAPCSAVFAVPSLPAASPAQSRAGGCWPHPDCQLRGWEVLWESVGGIWQRWCFSPHPKAAVPKPGWVQVVGSDLGAGRSRWCQGHKPGIGFVELLLLE